MTTLPSQLRLGLLSAKPTNADRESGVMDHSAEAAQVEAAKRDPAAFAPLFQAYYDKVLTYAYRCTMNITVAEELTSNTFFKAVRAMPKYRRGIPFSAWLYRIATNEIRMPCVRGAEAESRRPILQA